MIWSSSLKMVVWVSLKGDNCLLLCKSNPILVDKKRKFKSLKHFLEIFLHSFLLFPNKTDTLVICCARYQLISLRNFLRTEKDVLKFIVNSNLVKYTAKDKGDIAVRRGFSLLGSGVEDQISEITTYKFLLHIPVAERNPSRKENLCFWHYNGETVQSCLSHPKTPKLIPCWKDCEKMGITFSYLSVWEIFLASEWQRLIWNFG